MSSLKPESEVVLTIEKPAAGGRMLARHDGQIVFVAGAIPGERVRARVDRVTRQLGFADVIDVLEPSPDRRDPGMDAACGGSLYAHIAYRRQLSLKSELVADAFARIAKIRLPAAIDVMGSPEDGYRTRARLHVRNGRIGFVREGTHEVCDPGPTRQLLPVTVEALVRLQAALAEKGVLTALSCELAENIAADERVVLIDSNRQSGTTEGMRYIEGITGLSPGYGSLHVRDRIQVSGTPVMLTHHVRSFFQGNRWLLPQLAERVVARVPADNVIDLYAGVGLFAVSLAATGRKGIVAIEGDRWSAADLGTNARPYDEALTVHHQSVEDYLAGRRERAGQTFVLDPPRTGVSNEAMAGLIAVKPPQIVYVSCDVATLARDVRRFGEAGYSLEHLEGFDLFPNTAHVEILAVLTSRTP